MRKRWKRMAVILGAAMVMICQKDPLLVRAEEVPAEETPAEETLAEEAVLLQEASETEDVETKEVKAEKQERSTNLAPATDLKWECDVKPGLASFTIPNEKGTAWYNIYLYLREDDQKYNGVAEYYTDEIDNAGINEKVYAELYYVIHEEGTYKFEVVTVDPTTGEELEETRVFSDTWTYVAPTEQLPVPKNMSWNKDGIFSCERPDNDNFAEYIFSVYDSNGKQVCLQFSSQNVADLITENEGIIIFNLNEYLKKAYNITPSAGYFVVVQAKSNDMTVCKDSERSKIMFNNGSAQIVDSGSSSSSSDEVVVIEEWKPTTPDEIKRYEVYGKEKIHYTADAKNAYPVTVQNAMQGKMCFDSFEAALEKENGNWTIGRTYNIFPSGMKVYQMDSKARITLNIPKALQADGREFKIVCVTEKGRPVVLKDVDSSSETITFETDTYYAFALIYKDKAAAK